jgi:hypothetical protein
VQTKLTLRLDDRLIARAKAWAKTHDTSVSEAVAGFFAQLPDRDMRSDLAGLSPWTRRLVGAARAPGRPLPADEELQRDYVDYLEAKYR